MVFKRECPCKMAQAKADDIQNELQQHIENSTYDGNQTTRFRNTVSERFKDRIRTDDNLSLKENHGLHFIKYVDPNEMRLISPNPNSNSNKKQFTVHKRNMNGTILVIIAFILLFLIIPFTLCFFITHYNGYIKSCNR